MLLRYRQHVVGNKQHVALCNRGFTQQFGAGLKAEKVTNSGF